MQEFSSVTASSYDADSLAPLLTEKSAEGWSVVSIVSAGTSIVAYLEREADESAPAAATDDAAVTEAEVATPDVDVESAATQEEEATSADDAVPFVPTAAAAAVVADAVATDAPAAVDEPAGWAVAPESDDAPAVADTTTDESLADLVAEVEASETADAAPAVAVAAEPAAEEPAAAEPAAADSAVPAGWYADPSGRFELRYWDGAAWTEHVSRAGQQFTDPPVA
ncbi:MAG: DUF2510 domain-containing protein [Ilumatobacteraceae bacterium]